MGIRPPSSSAWAPVSLVRYSIVTMGNSPTGYWYGGTGPYGIVEPERSTFQGYAIATDSWLLGGFFTALIVLWSLVWSELLNFLQFTYVLLWPLVVNFSMMWVELGLILLGLCVCAYYATVADADMYLNKAMAAKITPNSPTAAIFDNTVILARRSRYNINADLVMLLVLLSFTWLEVTWVSCYAFGTVGDAWATKTAAGLTASAPLYTYNYPLTSSHWPSTLTARLIDNVRYRSYVHLFVMVKGIICMVALFLSRYAAMELADRKAYHFERYEKNKQATPADMHYLLNIGAPVGAAAPFMGTSTTSAVPLTTYANA